MKPPKFHVGQAVVLVRKIEGADPECVGPDPKPGPVYIVNELEWHEDDEWGWFVGLEGFVDDNFWEGLFRAVELLPDEALAELKELLEPVTA